MKKQLVKPSKNVGQGKAMAYGSEESSSNILCRCIDIGEFNGYCGNKSNYICL